MSTITCYKAHHSLWHTYQLAKHTRLPFASSSSSTFTPFELLHCVVWTTPVFSNSGYNIIQCCLMTLLISVGSFLYVKYPRFISISLSLLSMSTHSFACDLSASKLITAPSLLTMPPLLLLLLEASCCAIHAHTPRLRMAKLNMSFAPST